MISNIKFYIKSFFNKLGYEVTRFNPSESQLARLIKGFEIFGVDFVIDIGANTGQFAKNIRHAGYNEIIVSVEPMTSAHKELLDESKKDQKWNIFERCAIGDHNGEIEINISENSVSSSLLPMLDTHYLAAPESVYINKELVKIKTLDVVMSEIAHKNKSPFLKIDTQGYEWEVLDGAKNSLSLFAGILVEISFAELYQGQRLWKEIILRLESNGFELWSIEPNFIDKSSGKVLQADALFFRTKTSNDVF